jgi:NADH-quinone oxidoreductase subunit K
MNVPVEAWVALSGVVFAIGAMGVMVRRSAIMIFLSVELMLNAANLALVAFAYQWAGLEAATGLTAQSVVFIVLALAAAEVAVGLGILVTIFRDRATTDVDALSEVRL